MSLNFESLLSKAYEFLEQLFDQLDKLEIDVSKLELDHICFRVASMDEYLSYKDLFSEHGELLIEHAVNGRLIASFKLERAIHFGAVDIKVIELPAPKENSFYATGFEHAEFVVKDNLDDFIANYSQLKWDFSGMNKELNRDARLKFNHGIAVKFHEKSLFDVIQIEKGMAK
jgi:predicted metalloenzyme YecM